MENQDNAPEVQATEEVNPLQGHAAKLLDETKAAKAARREAEQQLTAVSERKNQYKQAYSDLIKANLTETILTKANINQAGRPLIKAYLNEVLELGKDPESNLPTFTAKGFDNFDSLAKAIKENPDFGSCIAVDMGGAKTIETKTIYNTSPYDNKPTVKLGIG